MFSVGEFKLIWVLTDEASWLSCASWDFSSSKFRSEGFTGFVSRIVEK